MWQVGDRTAELSEYRGDRTDPLPVGRCTPALAPLTAPCASCEDLTMRDSPEEEEVGRVFTSPVFQIPIYSIRTGFRAYSWKKKKNSLKKYPSFFWKPLKDFSVLGQASSAPERTIRSSKCEIFLIFVVFASLRWNSWGTSIEQKTRVFYSMLFKIPSTSGFWRTILYSVFK